MDARHFIEGVFLVYAALLPIVNPLGAAPVFLAMTRYADDPTRAVLARKVTFNSFVLLMASVFIGTYVLEFFGLSVPVVQLGGGLTVLLLGGFMIVMFRRDYQDGDHGGPQATSDTGTTGTGKKVNG